MGTPAPLVGRRVELPRLCAVLTGREDEIGGRAALLVAEAGAGKTRIVEEALHAEQIEPDRIIHVRGGELTAPLPFVAMRRALRRGAGESGRIDDLLDDYRADGNTVARAELVDAFADVVERRAFAGPLVLVVDDAHWVDEASMAVIDLVARQLPSTPVRLILAARPHPRPTGLTAVIRTLRRSDRLDRIPLPRLSTADARELTESLLGGPAGPGVHALVDRAGGNPLYCTELGLALRDQVRPNDAGLLELTDPDRHIDLDVIEHNLAALDADCRRLLADAALFGTTLDANELALLVDEPVSDVVDQLAAALRSGVLAEDDDGRLRFRHDLVRDAVIAALPRAAVAERHRDIVETLEGAGLHPTTWAGHLVLADWTGHPRAWELFERAAESMAAQSLSGAADLLDHAMEALDGDPPVSFVSLQLERLLDADRERDVQALLDWFRRHRRSSLDARADTVDLLALRALEAKWWHRARYGDLDLVSWFDQLQPAIALGTEDVVALDKHFAGLFLHGEPEHYARVLEIARRAGAQGNVPLETTAAYTGAFGAMLTHGLDQAVAAFTESVERQLATGHRPALLVQQLATMVLTVRARDEQVRPLLDRVTRQAERLGPPASILLGLLHARFAMVEGRWAEALQLVDEFVEWDRDQGFPNLILPTRATWPVIAYLGAGRADSARHVLDQAQPPLQRMHDDEVDLQLSTHHRDRALVELFAGGDAGPDLDRAIDHRLAGRLDRVCDLELSCYVALAALTGRSDLLSDYDECVQGSRHLRPEDAALLDVLTGRKPDRAQEVGKQALERHDFLAAQAIAERADPATGVALLRAAHRRAVDAGAEAWRDQTARALEGRGVTPSDQRSAWRPVTGLEALTPAERRVLPLILEGLLYREIAEQLHNSRRTIESHAAAIMRKLGVSSRRDLARTVGANEAAAIGAD